MERRNRLITTIIIRALALISCTIPVLTATLSYFPLWISKGEAYALSGFALCLSMLAILPFCRHLSGLIRSPSAYLIWLILFVIFFLLSKIADEMTVISFVGFISNLVGALLFKLAARLDGGVTKDE